MPTCLAVSTQKHYHCLIMLKVRWICLYVLEVNKISKAEGSQALMGFPNSSQGQKFLPERFWQSKRHLRSTRDVFALDGIGCFLSSQPSAVSASNCRIMPSIKQSKPEVCKAHLTTSRLSQKWIKQSLKRIVSSTFENSWEPERSFLVMLGLCTDLVFPTTVGASAGISSSGEELCHQW